MNRCSGILGKQCTCGRWHGGAANDEPRSMLAGRWFWLSAVIGGLLWGAVGLLYRWLS
ncbi:MAG TPA: hypothetical protein VEB23_15095 [Ramlibacter sp.]|nr:hypothetical protein [Ramlibacter sp.]